MLDDLDSDEEDSPIKQEGLTPISGYAPISEHTVEESDSPIMKESSIGDISLI